MTEKRKIKQIAIIGGGVAGLATAYFLLQKGFRVSLFEKEKEPGGLLKSIKLGNVTIEQNYHHFFRSDQHLLNLFMEVGLGDSILWRKAPNAFYLNGSLHSFVRKSDFLRLPFLSPKAKIRSVLGALQLSFIDESKIDSDETVKEFAIKVLGKEVWEKIWQPLFIGKFGDQYDRISAQWFARKLKIRGQSTQNGREVLGYLNGGFQKLIDALTNEIKGNHGSIFLGHKIDAITTNVDGTLNVGSENFDYVISTVPPKILKSIIPKLEVPEVDYLASISTLVALKNNPAPYYWTSILDNNLPFSVIVNQQSWLPKGYYRNVYPQYFGHYLQQDDPLLKKDDDELFAHYLPCLQRIFPNIEKEIITYTISRTPYAQPVFAAGWRQLERTTNIKNLFYTSMAHIFPEDRGINYAIKEAKEIASRIH